MGWVSKLRAWNYPEERIDDLARVLERYRFKPERYDNPISLGLALKSREEELKRGMVRGERVIPKGAVGWAWDKIVDFFKWLWDRIGPYVIDLMVVGAGVMVFSVGKGMYRALGAIPIIGGVADMLRRVRG